MDSTRIAKVNNVTLCRRGEQVSGSLHITAHHLIFSFNKPPPLAPFGLDSPATTTAPPSSSASAPASAPAFAPAASRDSRSSGTSTSARASSAARPRELWITYPIISQCTLRPYPSSSSASASFTTTIPPSNTAASTDTGAGAGTTSAFTSTLASTSNLPPTSSRRQTPRPSHIRLQCRDFAFICFYFMSEIDARETFETIRNFTCRIGRVERLYAFKYNPIGNEAKIDGWKVYDARREWERMEVDKCGWRISTINADYGFSPTYPALLPVPATISDNTVKHAGKYRSRARIPVLTYLHPVNSCSITRSSQPLTGIRQHRSAQDEKLLAEIFFTTSNQTNSNRIGESGAGSAATPSTPSAADSKTDTSALSSHFELGNAEKLEDAMISSIRRDSVASSTPSPKQQQHHHHQQPPCDLFPIYGAQQHNLIVDARPTVNAMAMQAMGAGSENMDSYPFATKAYLGIDNIHVMRESLYKIYEALKDSDLSPLPPNKDLLARSNWLKHIGGILDGASLIARQVGLSHSHVLIHCSDGWDRTSQLSALSQLCLEPYYRTLEGFMVLVEKDWLAFGHNFRLRGGVLSCKDWFKIESGGMGMPGMGGGGQAGAVGVGIANDDWTDNDESQSSGGGGAGKAIGNAFNSARGFFNRGGDKKEKEREREREREREQRQSEECTTSTDAPESNASTRTSSRTASVAAPTYKPSEYETVNQKETSPVFHQFLDATYQLLYQHPTRFEFNERFLRRLLYHSHSAQYGTFLFNSEKERVDMHAQERTRSVWSYFLARKEDFLNPSYDPTIDDNVRGKERLLFPNKEKVRWWSQCFNRPDAEMNIPVPASEKQQQTSGLSGKEHKRSTSVLAGVEAAGVSRSTEQHAGGMMPGNIDIGATMSSGIAALAAGLSSLGLGGGGGGGEKAQAQAKEKARRSDSSRSQSSSLSGKVSDERERWQQQEQPSKQEEQEEQAQQKQHSQFPPVPSQPYDDDDDGLAAPDFYRDPLAEEVRELYAKVRRASPRVGLGRHSSSSTLHSSSSDQGADLLASSKTISDTIHESPLGRESEPVIKEADEKEDGWNELDGKPTRVKPRNPLLDPLLGEEPTEITFLGRREKP